MLPSGELNENKILKSEVLYRGMNGKEVVRFYISPTQSYIFKPLTNTSQIGKEIWIYEHVLCHFPPFYPKVLCRSHGKRKGHNWIIFEDIGSLQHVYNEELVLNVTKLMACWHNFPVEKVNNTSLKGPKPPIEEILLEIRNRKKEVITLLTEQQIPGNIIEKLAKMVEDVTFTKEIVFSHGDLHLGNYARSSNKVYVLDWEHAHLNSRFWDLYHLIDMSHPLFPKIMSPSFREKILDYYLEQCMEVDERQEERAFKREYYFFSAIFSIWMLLLIQSDFNSNNSNWPKHTLKKQLDETISCLQQCANVVDF